MERKAGKDRVEVRLTSKPDQRLDSSEISALPRVPAVHLMLGGSPRFAAYVGIGGDLRERVDQYLVKRATRRI
jgi:hypothetical protein